MRDTIKLSIIIVNFNTYKYLSDCLDSLKRATKPNLPIEITVIENASSDDSTTLIKKKFPQVKLIENQKNYGFAKANNQGVREATGNYILLLNPDTIVPGETLKFMIDYMDTRRQVGVSTCKVLLPDGSLDDGCHRGFPTPWRAFCYFSSLAKIFPKSRIFNGYHLGYQNMDKIHEIESCVGAFMMIRRIAGDEVGWLDEDYFWYGEDLDFCYRVKQKGWKVMFVPQVSVVHYKGVSSGIKNHSKNLSTADENTRKIATRARFEVMRIFYKKHYQNKYPFWLRWLVLMGIKMKELIT